MVEWLVINDGACTIEDADDDDAEDVSSDRATHVCLCVRRNSVNATGQKQGDGCHVAHFLSTNDDSDVVVWCVGLCVVLCCPMSVLLMCL